jgi:hypothetical protein
MPDRALVSWTIRDEKWCKTTVEVKSQAPANFPTGGEVIFSIHPDETVTVRFVPPKRR